MVDEQLAAIAELLALAQELDTPVWLRGGWAVDFFLGRITRPHADIDWFVLAADASRLRAALLRRGFTDVTTAPSGQQVDLIRGGVEHGIALVVLNERGEPLVGGGPWAGEPWPVGMLDGPIGCIDDVRARVISPAAQIEIKEMTPLWNPRLVRRQKDLDDMAEIRSQLLTPLPPHEQDP